MSETRSLPAFLLDPASRALNAALAADPEALRTLRTLSGRRVAVEISDLSLVVPLAIAGERIELGGAAEGADATVSGRMSALIAAGRSGNPRGLTVAGDAEVVQSLARVTSRLPRAAWERVATILGAGPSRALERLAGSLRKSLEGTRDRLSENVAEYLQYEARLVVSRAELEDFLGEVDRLRADAERLAKRVERLRGGRRA
ncbi:MAG TPA: SCP2 sterol-binding domain-containing protein [Gammaproteobacteria bacterium]|nr:SCP2 sterol-binding domain-containing protein [Gammaproteobacteria bacterium]